MPLTLERELIHVDGQDGGRQLYCISGAYVEAADQNVSLPLPEGADKCGECFMGLSVYPECPDCGGRIVLGSGGPACAPGGRYCRKCGSRFADMREHTQEPGLHMPREVAA